MGVSKLEVSSIFLTELCKAVTEGDRARMFRVTENGLPENAKLVGVDATWDGGIKPASIYLLLEHESFEDGAELRPPVCTIVYEREPSEDQIERAAEAIANARGGRRGMPPITNILAALPDKLADECREDARAALEAAAGISCH